MKLYVVISEGIYESTDQYVKVLGIYLSKKRAIARLKSIVEDDMQRYPDVYLHSSYEHNWSEDSTYFEVFEKGYFNDNHFTVTVHEYDTKIKRM